VNYFFQHATRGRSFVDFGQREYIFTVPRRPFPFCKHVWYKHRGLIHPVLLIYFSTGFCLFRLILPHRNIIESPEISAAEQCESWSFAFSFSPRQGSHTIFFFFVTQRPIANMLIFKTCLHGRQKKLYSLRIFSYGIEAFQFCLKI